MKKHRFNMISMAFVFSITTFFIFITTALISAIIGYFLTTTSGLGVKQNAFLFVLISLLISVVIGTVISIISGPKLLRPFKQIVKAMNKLAGGDFSVRLNFTRPPEFQVVSESFNRMAKELGGIEVLRNDFVDNFSHEFKTPIMSIKGFAEILKDNNLAEEERKEYLNIIIDESSRLSVLATNVLNLSKIETQTILIEPGRFNVGEQVRQCILMLETEITKKNITLTPEIQDFTIMANKDLLNQVRANLLDNAIKFTDKDGKIDVSVHRIQNEAVIIFMDNGRGIDKEAMSHIYDKYYQADASHSVAGNGLGLTIAKKIIDLHGGQITCESIAGRGATFIVRLPVGSH
jgi:signal transduction histidine kinase